MEESGIPADLYPLALIGWRWSARRGGSGEVRITDRSPDDVYGIQIQLEFHHGERFVRIEDDEDDTLFVRREDVAFVDLVDLHYDEDLNGVGFKPEKLPEQGRGSASDLDDDGVSE